MGWQLLEIRLSKFFATILHENTIYEINRPSDSWNESILACKAAARFFP
jgi:hypothetical protein